LAQTGFGVGVGGGGVGAGVAATAVEATVGFPEASVPLGTASSLPAGGGTYLFSVEGPDLFVDFGTLSLSFGCGGGFVCLTGGGVCFGGGVGGGGVGVGGGGVGTTTLIFLLIETFSTFSFSLSFWCRWTNESAIAFKRIEIRKAHPMKLRAFSTRVVGAGAFGGCALI